VSKPFTILVVLLALFGAQFAYGDDTTREVQEELRKRNLYFGDVDGRQTPGFIEAVKKYQERKGFAVTGATDADTLRSLGLSSLEVAPNAQLPDVPVLRSDRNMSGDRAAATAPAASQPPRPDAPPPGRAEMISWLRRYLEACQTPDTNDELGYYAGAGRLLPPRHRDQRPTSGVSSPAITSNGQCDGIGSAAR
jgi:peptidoglycan hydrolase-like protein with peptidoglycan-binding domain